MKSKTTTTKTSAAGAAFGFVLLIMAVSLPSCGASPSAPDQPPPPPPPPPPAPSASFATEGGLRWFDCTMGPGSNTCTFEAMARNVGNACAQNVRGTIRFFAMQGGPELASGPWSLVPTIKVAPTDTFTFSGNFGLAVRNQTTAFAVDFMWDDVAC